MEGTERRRVGWVVVVEDTLYVVRPLGDLRSNKVYLIHVEMSVVDGLVAQLEHAAFDPAVLRAEAEHC